MRLPARTLCLLPVVVCAVVGTARAQPADAPPSTPEGLVARAYSGTAGGIRWERSRDDAGIVPGYEVARDGTVLGVFDALSYVDFALEPGRAYRYAVTAIDTAGQRSGTAEVTLRTAGDGVAATPVAPTGPAAPTGLRAAVYSRTAAELFWNRSDVFGLRYEIRRDGRVLTIRDGLSYFDDTLSAGTAYDYEVIAIDSRERRSAPATVSLVTRGVDPSGNAPLITAANHLEVLATVFDVFSGNAYGRFVFPLRDYSGRARLLDETDPFAIPTPTVPFVCDNGGTGTFRRTAVGLSGLGIAWTFDDCQDADRVLDGAFDAKDAIAGAGYEFRSTGIDARTPDGEIAFAGSLLYVPSGRRGSETRSWEATVERFSFDGATESLELRSLSTSHVYQFTGFLPQSETRLEGGFELVSPITGGRTLRVETPEPLARPASTEEDDGDLVAFTRGRLRVTAPGGNTLELDAANGDPATARVTIVAGDRRETLVVDWRALQASLRFAADGRLELDGD